MEQGRTLVRRCEIYSEEYILSKNLKAKTILEQHIVKYKSIKRNKDNEDNEDDEEEEERYSVIFDRDGFTHRRCPVSEASQEIQAIIYDTLYCLDNNSFPDPGTIFDQTEIYRKASTVLFNEREKIKNEREKAAVEEAKRKGKKDKSGSRKSIGRR